MHAYIPGNLVSGDLVLLGRRSERLKRADCLGCLIDKKFGVHNVILGHLHEHERVLEQFSRLLMASCMLSL